MAIVFVAGYAGIVFEESLAFNKSGVGLLMAVSLWVIRSLGVRSAHWINLSVSGLLGKVCSLKQVRFCRPLHLKKLQHN